MHVRYVERVITGSIVGSVGSGLTGGEKKMNVLEKILEEIKQPTNYTVMCGKHFTTIDRVEEIIRSHMDDCKTFEFDFNRVKSFDCQCGRHYVNTYNNGWIPVDSDNQPKDEERVLVSFENFNEVLTARYKAEEGGGTFLLDADDTDESFASHDLYVSAWQPLPDRYKGE